MIDNRSYKVAFGIAIFLHLFLIILLTSDQSTTHPVLTETAKNDPMEMQAAPTQQPEAEPIQAVSVDSQEVQETVERLKQERLQQKQAEDNHQKALQQQADAARQKRLEEQAALQKLKDESAKIALAHKKELEEEKKHLQQLAKEKAEQEKNLAEMKKQQQLMQKKQEAEATKLALLKKKNEDELAKNAAKARADKEKADQLIKQQAAIEKGKMDAAKNAQIAGEVDKYKALIINAIGHQWILPENVNASLSSQFRIRLAPNGAVLEVSLTRSSGDAILDRSAQSAIYKASPLPVPSSPEAFNVFRDISLTVRPESARG